MNFSESVSEGFPVVCMNGRIDSSTAKTCEDYLLSHVADGRPALVLDLAKVDYVSSAGLRVLVMASQRAMGLGRGFAVCNLQEDVAEVMEISGLEEVLNVCEDLGAAISAVKA
ncbi:MAG: STAS domain-containing protein [Alphaproteobacteria bacterium]|nr:STAS domain-containing protein [Alphaproteobacteria bacterium]